jgi:hypothetical protein
MLCKANTNICVLDIYLGQAERVVYPKKKKDEPHFRSAAKEKRERIKLSLKTQTPH